MSSFHHHAPTNEHPVHTHCTQAKLVADRLPNIYAERIAALQPELEQYRADRAAAAAARFLRTAQEAADRRLGAHPLDGSHGTGGGWALSELVTSLRAVVNKVMSDSTFYLDGGLGAAGGRASAAEAAVEGADNDDNESVLGQSAFGELAADGDQGFGVLARHMFAGRGVALAAH